MVIFVIVVPSLAKDGNLWLCIIALFGSKHTVRYLMGMRSTIFAGIVLVATLSTYRC